MSSNIDYKTVVIAILCSIILSTAIVMTVPQVQEAMIGDTGEEGPQGEQGEQGEQGIQGIRGERGITGDQGPQGLKGDTGATGARGLTGSTGSQGLRGATGSQGAQGPRGYTGPKGDKGDPGGVTADVTGLLTSEYHDVWGMDYHVVEGMIINFGTDYAYSVTVKVTWHNYGGGTHTEPAVPIGALRGHQMYDFSYTFYFEGGFDYLTYEITWS